MAWTKTRSISLLAMVCRDTVTLGVQGMCRVARIRGKQAYVEVPRWNLCSGAATASHIEPLYTVFQFVVASDHCLLCNRSAMMGSSSVVGTWLILQRRGWQSCDEEIERRSVD